MRSAKAEHRRALPPLGPAGRRLVVLLLAITLLLAGAFAAITVQDHRASLEEGWVTAELAAIGAAEHAERSLAAARLVTERVADRLRQGDPAQFRGAGQADLLAKLRHAPQIGSLWILDAEGRIAASSVNPDPPALDFADRPFFAPLRAGDESHLTPMLRARVSGIWFFSYNRAVRDADDGFLGIVQASMHAGEFQRFQRGLGMGAAGRVTLARTADGAPLMLYPLPAAAGPDDAPLAAPGTPPAWVRQAALRGEARSGRFAAEGPDGSAALVAWHLAGPPGAVIATAALPRTQALASFRRRLGRNAVLFGLAAAILAGLGAAVGAAQARGAANRRVAEAGRRELSAVLEATGEGVIALDADWRIRFVNTRAAAALAGGRDISGQPIWTALPELAEGPIRAACRRSMESGMSATAEATLPSSGRCFQAESRRSELGGIVVFLRDVTEERAAAARLAESEARLRRVLDNLFAFVGVLAPDGRLLEANRAPLEAAGLTLADVQGKPFWECHWWSWDRAVQDGVRAACERAAAGEASRYDVVVRMKDDSRMTIDFQIAPLFDAEGRVTHLIPSATDVTARSQAEAALAESEARLRLAQEGAEVGVYEFDHHARQAHWSPMMFRLYGLDPAGRRGLVEEPEFVAVLHPEDHEAEQRRRHAVWADPSQTRFRAEFRIRRPDTGEVRWIATRGEVVRDAAGEPVLTRGVNYDITERRRDEEKRMLLAREVDHRAKNALAVVQSIVGLTREPDPARFREAVTGRIAAMARAHTLLAREGWGSAELRELIEAEVAPHRGALAGETERVSLEGPLVALAPGAAQPLAMALHELATNAVKYGALSAAGGRVRIRWTDAPDGGLLLHWTEQAGPRLEGAPARTGFGSSVIRNTVERQLGGRTMFRWLPEGLDCTLALPPAQLRWPQQAAE